jgi:protein involved in polysaccharide export with SLBB domain
MASGEIYLPLVGAVQVAGKNLLNAQRAVNNAYANGFLVDPKATISLAEKATVSIVVLGKVNNPGSYLLPRHENDVAHALALAGGFTEDAADHLEVHRRFHGEEVSFEKPKRLPPLADLEALPTPSTETVHIAPPDSPKVITRICLRGPMADAIGPDDIVLRTGDVVVVPSRRDEVFYVVGKLAPTNAVRFNVGERDRELGIGLVLPRDREIDVVTAVAMAGYIDPIDSPTTVTVQRAGPNGQPMLIRVDLIKARYDARETVLVQPGDILYLNPDGAWYFRRTFDRVIADIIKDITSLSYRKLLRLQD